MPWWYVVLVALVGLERLAALIVARRNAAWSRARGGLEFAAGHYRTMVVLHSALLAGALAEVLLANRSFLPWLGWPMLALVLAAQSLRWWCIRTLGPQWNTRIIVVPGLSRVTTGTRWCCFWVWRYARWSRVPRPMLRPVSAFVTAMRRELLGVVGGAASLRGGVPVHVAAR